ncbi:glucosamine-6-phosphate isomerase [Chryseobacterium lactis]|uniref:Glucosamine-6-phosphate isomerase n=1 Tax=Chryseobacterium lactis TaxID=1241981 RepID=A0A3G6RJK1_CHRLC|nr:glucosamine-6-phosphate isomerase [Chryseobacterium lactis]AZA82765.1 glucosamine-6-phosphate isomerase [Chryseobacterium lactis]AZB03147.1 glucosamine-6-phosphate isomerase [Chryseobacterium lactis]PNW11216.1 glucosamine-6-phosphate isomerase [Chryseobacterium lactis]
MENKNFSPVEQSFLNNISKNSQTNVPYIAVDNFPTLGMLTAFRFLEWASENPHGVISLPTGKTPEHFIYWTKHILENWDREDIFELRKKHQLVSPQKPSLADLHFVQIDEFYPIKSSQANSFYHYVNKYYIEGLGLKRENAILINCDEIPLADGKSFEEIFPDHKVDLELRYIEPRTPLEKLQKESVFLIDNWCSDYEQRIRKLGGIGFFLGGIGPDGHIAFNVKGSDPYSTTRLTATNFETQAVAAGDLGGIEISRERLVITIGLETITYNKDAVAIIFAAGEAKAPMIKNALELPPSNLYPASVLSKLPNSRFYITLGAASMLNDLTDDYYQSGSWSQEKTDKAVMLLTQKLNKYAEHLTLEDLQADEYTRLIPGLDENTVQSVITSIENKIKKATDQLTHEVFYHTGPHHDDISLGLLPYIHYQSRNETNESHYSVLTSGFTAVTNKFLTDILRDTLSFVEKGEVEMLNYPDFFEVGYQNKRDKDVYHYLINIASENAIERSRAVSHRMVRNIVELWNLKTKQELEEKIHNISSVIHSSYDGQNPEPKIQTLKGMIREYEEELVWAHFGVRTKNVSHLRLGFYTGAIFTEKPNRERDVYPILQQLKEINPTVISLAFDPEGSGPDTHYKVLQAIAAAVREWGKEKDLSQLKIWGYRNVWYQFNAADVTHIFPVSLNAMSTMDESFTNSYLSQVNASFPSYRYNGKFSHLSIQTWVEQLQAVQLILGKPYFYDNNSPRLRATHGLLFFKEMDVEEFLQSARELEQSTEGVF